MKETPYFSDVPDSVITAVNLANRNQLKIQPDDILNITLQTTDPLATANLNNISGANTMTSSTNTTSGQYLIGGGQNAIGSDGVGFLVDSLGELNLPIFGRIKLSEMSTDSARNFLQKKADKLYKNATVNVRFVNMKIGVLGEVNRPGYFYMGNEKNTILDALLMAGDMTIYGKRKNVLLLRDSAGVMTMHRFNMDSKDMLTSQYFYLKQRDVIYVEPNKARIQGLNSPVYTKVGLAVSILTLLVLVWTRIDNN
ncbi:polysaccharide biosynthesis/export family protein [Rhizosphaericola mali]|nr:polysaccharide biosynthesis/export family protein [Rhizosphaericola mali]